MNNTTSSGSQNASSNNNISFENSLECIRYKNVNKLIIGNININSISNKIDQLKVVVQGNLDILVVTETKIDESFPSEQLSINGFSKPYRLDRNRNGGGILIYVWEDIPSKELKLHKMPSDIESLFVELNLFKTKWLVCGCYHPPSQPDQYFFDNIGNALDKYSQYYEKFLLAGDFNAEDSETCLSQFLYEYHAHNIVKDKTCFKSTSNPSCIDLFITNSPLRFHNTMAISTGLSDFHKMVVTVMKMKLKKTHLKKFIIEIIKTSTKRNLEMN